MHVATTSVEKLLDYVINTPEDGWNSEASVNTIINLANKNDSYTAKRNEADHSNPGKTAEVFNRNN
jgi:hypothetical protein